MRAIKNYFSNQLPMDDKIEISYPGAFLVSFFVFVSNVSCTREFVFNTHNRRFAALFC